MSLLPPWSAPLSFARTAWDLPDGPRAAPSRPGPAESDGTGGAFAVDWTDAPGAAAHRDAWVALAARALEPNVFLAPDFALPAAQHLGPAGRPGFALVWDGAEPRRLVAVCALVGGGGMVPGLASAWMHDLSTLGFPLLDRDCAAEALEALLRWAVRGLPRAAGLMLRAVPTEGPTAAALGRVAATLKRDVAVIDAWDRAVLRRGGAAPMLSPKGAKALRRQGRRLAERGALVYESARSDEDLRDAVERFLALEAAGWKGRAGTALLAAPGRTAFLRTMTRQLGRAGACRVDSLTLDGEPVAMGIVLSQGEADFFWKTAYREDLAALSPGVHFVLALTDAQARQERVAVTDSCAVPDHPMIGRLWRDRMRLADIVISTRRAGAPGFRIALAAERGRRRLRALAKRAQAAWRHRRAPAA